MAASISQNEQTRESLVHISFLEFVYLVCFLGLPPLPDAIESNWIG